MGDRINLKLKYSQGEPIYLYSHWGGSGMKETIKSALIRGKDRWDDESYLARIIFCEMVRWDVEGLTGYGIAPYECDPENKTITVDLADKKVNSKTFSEFVGEELK